MALPPAFRVFADGAVPRWLLLAVLLLAGIVPSRSASAAGREVQVRGEDFLMIIDSRWPGCGNGGYYPIRVRITNLGPSRTVSLQFHKAGNGGDEGTATVTRTVRSETNSTQTTTLSVPMLGVQSYGVLSVYADGRLLENFTQSMSLADYATSDHPRASLLVISPVNEDGTGFDSGAYNEAASSGARSSAHYGGGYAKTEDHLVLPPSALPDKWIDYSGVDYVAISLATLDALPAGQRDPLLDWVMAGGNLIVYDVKSDRAGLDRAVGRGGRATLSPWVERRAEKRPLAVTPGAAPMVVGAPPVAPAGPGAAPSPSWPDRDGAIVSANLALGRLHGFEFNPFGPTAENWLWFLMSEPEIHRTFARRNGTVPRERGQGDFFHFLIPGVGAAPVFMFLLLISLFAIAIGPVNLWILSRRRQLYLVLLTVPVMSLLTCICLFVYAFLADGLSTRARLRSVTYVDTAAARSVTLSRIMLYAGLSPSGGLSFSDRTAVFPVWPEESGAGRRTIDWTNTQLLESGWLPSRTFTQFAATAVEPQRGRLEVRPSTNGLSVNNGFTVGLQHLFVSDDSGRIFYGDNLAAGAMGTLSPLATTNTADFRKEWIKRLPALPEGLNPGSPRGWSGMSRYWRQSSPVARFERSLMEQELGRAAKLEQAKDESATSAAAPARWFWGVAESSPGVTAGTDSAVISDGFHVIAGRY